MAWTLQLLNDDTTLDLNDGTAYSGRPGFLAPPPPVRMAQGGANLFRHGSDIMERVYGNRTVTAVVRIHGTSQDNLIANILAVNNLLERAAEYTTTGLGSQVKLRRKWENASNQVDFHVLTGSLALGDEFGAVHSQNTTFANAFLTLTCKPFAYGAEETIENYVLDPGFELTATHVGAVLADWPTESKTASGTTARDTSVKKDGNASLKLVMTSGTSAQVISRAQILLDVDEAEVWSFQCWVRVDALNNCRVDMDIDYGEGTQVTTTTTTVNASSFVKLTANNNTVPATATQATIILRLYATGASATGTVYFDNVIAVLASAVPVAWASSHTLGNHPEDSSQAQSNYIDIQDVPGDVPALLQVRILENQSHDEFWAGARHAGRQHDDIAKLTLDGTDGTPAVSGSISNWTHTAASTDYSIATSLGNTEAASKIERTGVGIGNLPIDTHFRHTYTIATPPNGTYRVLVAARAGNGAGASATNDVNANLFQYGFSYTYGAFNLLDLTNPDTSSFVTLSSATITANTYGSAEILDLGTITIPPIATPSNQTGSSIDLVIHEGTNAIQAIQNAQEIYFYLDYVMLMPVDYGANYTSKTDAADVILLDSMSETKGIYLLNTSDVVQSFPSNQLGRSPEAHPDGTRIYMVGQNGTYLGTETYTVSMTYRPRFLHVMGA